MVAEHRSTELLGGLFFPEGARWFRNTLWFGDIQSTRVIAVDESGQARIVAQFDTPCSGVGFLPDGSVLASLMKERVLARVDAAGERSTHADLAAFGPDHINDIHQQGREFGSAHLDIEQVERVVIAHDHLLIRIASGTATEGGRTQEVRIARPSGPKDAATIVNGKTVTESARNEGLIQSIVRAHGWVECLRDGKFASIEALAEANLLHPKVVRQALRLAFLSPDLTSAILEGNQPTELSLAGIPKLLPLAWKKHEPMLAMQAASWKQPL